MHTGFLLSFALLLSQEFSATLKDGNTQTGSIKQKDFNLTTDFGSATIRTDQIGAIEFGDPDKVFTKSGTELHGELNLKTLRIYVGEKSKTIRRSQLLSLRAVVNGKLFGTSPFNGRWQTNFGPMSLTQSGLNIEGNYGFEDESSIRGMLRDGKFEFEWHSNGQSGSGVFEMWDDGEVFTGTYTLSNGQNDFWGGYKINPKQAKVQPGEITAGQTISHLNYHLRIPKGYDGQSKYPAIGFFHGSNMSSRPYIETIASQWPDLAKDYILVGFDGERLSSASSPGNVRYNSSYINFSGHEVGQPWRYRQTPGLVADALEELPQFLNIDHWIIGGHSQGGFLTYAIFMYYPNLVAGAFPMACNLLVQCEPKAFTNEKVRNAQREIPIAIIHGEADSVVDSAGGHYSYESFQDGGFPALRFLNPSDIGHSFMHLPVRDAVRWIEKFHFGNLENLVKFAADSFQNKEYRDAMAVILRTQQSAMKGFHRKELQLLAGKIDEVAAASRAKLVKAVSANKNGNWVDDFWEFRRQFAFAPQSQKLMDAYAELRKSHQKPADELFYASRSKETAERKKMQLQINEKYYASSWYKSIKRWWNID